MPGLRLFCFKTQDYLTWLVVMICCSQTCRNKPETVFGAKKHHRLLIRIAPRISTIPAISSG